MTRISKDQQIADMKRDRARRDAAIEVACYERALKLGGWRGDEELKKLLKEAKERLQANG